MDAREGLRRVRLVAKALMIGGPLAVALLRVTALLAVGGVHLPGSLLVSIGLFAIGGLFPSILLFAAGALLWVMTWVAEGFILTPSQTDNPAGPHADL